MATFVFDGTSNITAAKTDTVVITANPALFTSVSETGGNVVFSFGGRLLTVTGTTYGDNTTQYPNVSLANGTFQTGQSTASAPVTPNDLIIGSTSTVNVAGGGTAASVKAVFGGLGVSDPNDTADTITLGGKGSFLTYGNAGNDTIAQGQNTPTLNNAFDSTSFVTVFGGKGDDGITLNGGLVNAGAGNPVVGAAAATTNSNAKFAIYGGEGTDTISVSNTGTNANTAIFGGQGAADSTDSLDNITFNGGGTVNIFGNAGNDIINLGTTGGGLDSTTVAIVHGGRDADTIGITVNNVKANIQVFGDENNAGGGANNDVITVTGNAGTTAIYGGTAAADSLDNADTISYSGQGTATIYAAGGDDTVTLGGLGGATADSTSTTTVFGGNGADSINVSAGATATANGTITITAGAGADVIAIGGTADNTTSSAGTGQGITITDFTVGTGNDLLRVNNNVADAGGATSGKFIVDGASATTLQQALNLAAAANAGTQGTVSLVAFQGSAYVVVNQDNNSTFSATTDLAIKLTGVTDLAALSTAVTVV